MRKKQGFTLIELIVVIAIIAVITSIIAIKSFKSIDKARVAAVIEDYRAIKAAAMSYYADVGSWPANNNNSSFLDNDGRDGWAGPYLEKWPKLDTWSGSYSWRNSNSGFFSANGTNERYVEVTGVPSGAATIIDRNLDDGNVAVGSVIYSIGSNTLRIAVTHD